MMSFRKLLKKYNNCNNRNNDLESAVRFQIAPKRCRLIEDRSLA